MSCADSTAHTSLEQLFTGEIAADALVALRAHASGCADCRATYDKLTRVEAQLEKSKSGLPSSRMEFLQAQVLSRAAAQQSAVAAKSSAESSPGVWARLRMWMLPVGGLALAGVLAMVVVPRLGSQPTTGVDRDGFQARGSTTAGAGATYGVRAFCVTPPEHPGSSPKVLSEALPGQTLKCAAGNAVQFAYTAPKDAKLTVAAPTENGDWLTFVSGGEAKSGTDMPLSFSTPVTDSWLSKPVQVKARFEDPASGKLMSETSLTIEP